MTTIKVWYSGKGVIAVFLSERSDAEDIATQKTLI